MNLGFASDSLPAAIAAFQQKEELAVTGEADDATRARLQERFGQ
jgi:peptidoglycan hydrolase-like protein with peptidoglycan-binding domain